MDIATPIRVLVIDDSALIRKLLTMLLTVDPSIEVVGTAADPFEARERIKALNPDVVTLDIEMPKMDGLSFLQKIMTLRPMPVIMVSTLTQANGEATIRALELGAVDFVAKPTTNVAATMESLGDDLRTKVKAAARVRVRERRPHAAAIQTKATTIFAPSNKIVFIGASTGGVEAIREVVAALPANAPPVLVTQHMPERFTKSFADRLDTLCTVKVVEAAADMPIEVGHVYIAQGARHLEIMRRGNGFACKLHDGDPVSGHRPSVDVLFSSAARVVGPRAVGAILTGMGRDGAAGLGEMRAAGALTLGQDEETSLIYGMPQAAFVRGAVMHQYALNRIASAILAGCNADQQSLRTRAMEMRHG